VSRPTPPALGARRAPRRGTWLRALARLALLGLLLANALAWVQARAMTHFVAGAPPLDRLAAAPLPDKLRALVTGVGLPRPENRHTPADHYLPFETHHIALQDGEQLEAWFVPQPQPRGIVLMFHGYAGAKEAFLTPAAQLYQLGYSSLLVDFRGSGGSSRSDTTLGLREADDVAASFAYAQRRWPGQPVVLYGISMGGAAVLRAVAVNGVRPAAIIVEGVFDRLLTTVQHRFDALRLPSWPLAQLLVFWGGVQLGYDGFQHNPVDYAGAVACPTLVMRGERDPWVTGAETQALAARIGAPKRVVEVPGVGHEMPYVYPAPDLWVATVKRFLAEEVPADAP
jgi:alpha-beta hydrolase superfamily lysophospholipase